MLSKAFFVFVRSKPAANNVVAVMVEMYLTLIRDLPRYIADVNDVSNYIISPR